MMFPLQVMMFQLDNISPVYGICHITFYLQACVECFFSKIGIPKKLNSTVCSRDESVGSMLLILFHACIVTTLILNLCPLNRCKNNNRRQKKVVARCHNNIMRTSIFFFFFLHSMAIGLFPLVINRQLWVHCSFFL